MATIEALETRRRGSDRGIEKSVYFDLFRDKSIKKKEKKNSIISVTQRDLNKKFIHSISVFKFRNGRNYVNTIRNLNVID